MACQATTLCKALRKLSTVKHYINAVFSSNLIYTPRWLGVWIEVISSMIVFLSAVFSLVTPGINAATLGLSVTYALQVGDVIIWYSETLRIICFFFKSSLCDCLSHSLSLSLCLSLSASLSASLYLVPSLSLSASVFLSLTLSASS